MKTKFSKEYIMSNRGCYSREYAEALSFINKKEITINDFIDSEILTRDKYWWLIRKCELTHKECVQIAVDLAEIVLPIYENKYKSKEPRQAIEPTKSWLYGDDISSEALLSASNAAAAASDAADDAAYASYIAAANAAYIADDVAAANAAYAAYAAAYSAYLSYVAHVAHVAHIAYTAAAYAADAYADNTNNKYMKQVEDYLNKFKI